MFEAWLIVAGLIFIAGFCLTAWLHGKDELYGDDPTALIFLSAVCAAFWPALITIAVVALPFVGLYFLIKRLAEKCR